MFFISACGFQKQQKRVKSIAIEFVRNSVHSTTAAATDRQAHRSTTLSTTIKDTVTTRNCCTQEKSRGKYGTLICEISGSIYQNLKILIKNLEILMDVKDRNLARKCLLHILTGFILASPYSQILVH